MKFVIDLELCTGHGRCYALEPELFEPIDDDGRAGLRLESDVIDDATIRQRLETIERACPEQAIYWSES